MKRQNHRQNPNNDPPANRNTQRQNRAGQGASLLPAASKCALLGPDNPPGGTLVSIQDEHGKEGSLVDLGRCLSERLDRATAQTGTSLQQLVEAAVAHMLDRYEAAAVPAPLSSGPARAMAASPGARRRPQSRRPWPFFSLNLATWRLKELRSLASCAGVPLRTLLEWGVFKMQFQIERQLGLRHVKIARLSREQQMAIRRRYDLARSASLYAGREQRPFAEIDTVRLAWLPAPEPASPRIPPLSN